MNLKFIMLTLGLGIICTLSIRAQERMVKGKVTSFGSVGLKNVSILSKNSDSVVTTDEKGDFSLACNENEKLTFEANGFYSKKIKVSDFAEGDSIKVDLRYKKGKKSFDEAVSFGHISENQLNYAIEHLEAGPDYSNYRNILEAIESKVPGVTVSNSSINIRGNATLNSGSIPALLVVDGTIVEFPVFVNIPPSQIKSIDVLKGGAASARYGSRGMGGVVVVKTKNGN